MADPDDGPPMVPLPERVDRRLRLGPFPSAHDAVRFLGYAAVGTLLAAGVSPLAGFGVIVAGFVLSVVRVDGERPDRRAVSMFRYLFERLGRRVGPAVTGRSSLDRSGAIPGPAGGYLAVVRAGGSPMAYLPPAEIARRFEQFRELLRAEPEGLAFRVWLAPMRPTPVLPPPVSETRADAAARNGYAQLVRLICGRRAVRRIDLLRCSTFAGAEGLTELDGQVSRLIERLTELGLPARRLSGRSLADAARRLTEGPNRSAA
jgi:hypothetical protein